MWFHLTRESFKTGVVTIQRLMWLPTNLCNLFGLRDGLSQLSTFSFKSHVWAIMSKAEPFGQRTDSRRICPKKSPPLSHLVEENKKGFQSPLITLVLVLFTNMQRHKFVITLHKHPVLSDWYYYRMVQHFVDVPFVNWWSICYAAMLPTYLVCQIWQIFGCPSRIGQTFGPQFCQQKIVYVVLSHPVLAGLRKIDL